MTRETKIGLLVGLAFVIVVGILLSEHLTTTTERPAAALADAGRGVRQAVSTPGVGLDADLAKALEPTAPVPPAEQMAVPPAAPVVVPPPPAPVVEPTPLEIAPPPVLVQAADPFDAGPLQQAAQAHGEAIVPVPAPVEVAPPPVVAAADNVREYKAQPGDTLSRIAALLPGGSTLANREAIVKLNPTLQKDPNKILAGRTYLLPTDKAAKIAKTSAKGGQVAKAEKKPGERFYVVKPGDTLTKIAAEQLGSVKAVAVLRSLNADKVKNDVITVDMKLKLPAATVAASE